MSYDLQLQCKLNDGCQWQLLLLLLLLFLYYLLLLQTFWTALNGFCTFPCGAATNQLISFYYYYYLVLLPKRGKNCWQRNVRQGTRHEEHPAVVPFSMLVSIIMMKMLIMIITVWLVQESAYKALSVAARRVNYFRWGCKFYLLYYAWSVLPPKECKEEADKEREGEGELTA